MARRYFVHLHRQFTRRQDSLLKQDVCEGGDPALVVRQLADHFGAERLDSSALFLSADSFPHVEDIRQRVASLFPWQILMLRPLNGRARLSADIVRQPL
jgi:hypothetical protein